MRHSARRALLAAGLILCAVLVLKGSALLVPSGSWAPEGTMANARAGASAALLQDGRILITGGDPGTGPVATADFFATDGTISAAPPMTNPRSQHVSVTLQDGRVLVAGGLTTGASATNSAEIFDPVANSWASAGTGMTEARSGATAAVLQDGRVAIAGGQNGTIISSTIEIFDPNTGAFSAAGMMSSPRTQHAMALLQSGQVLIVGGNNGTAPVASTDIFDPIAGTMSAGPNLAIARYNHSATTLLNGQVVVIGGNNANADPTQMDVTPAELVDFTAATPAFTALATNLATPREGHLAFLLPNNNNVLIVGGTSAGTTVASAELFTAQDSPQGAWTYGFGTTGTMTAARSSATGSANQVNAPSTTMQRNGVLMVAGGNDANGNALNATEAYGYPTVQTDQGDYPPGTTVTMNGSGFQPGEPITIQLVESPLVDTHGPYTVQADANGNFVDTSFTTDLHDVNVLFYLSATGATSGFQTQNTFTDSTSISTAVVTTDKAGCSTASTVFDQGDSICASVSVTFNGNGGFVNDLQIVWFNPSNVIVRATDKGVVTSGGPFTDTLVTSGSTPTGSWTVKTCDTATCLTTGGHKVYSTATFTVSGAASKLVFTNPPVTVAAGACSGALTVQSQDSSGNPSNVSSAETLAPSANPSAGASFYTDSMCTTTVTGSNLTITSGSNTASFYFKDTAAGSPVITVTGSGAFTATGSSAATQTETVNAAAATQLVITGLGTQTAGTSQNLTITAEDSSGNTDTTYAGTKGLTFSGANPSTNPVTNPTVSDLGATAQPFGTRTNITFSSGVAMVSGTKNGVMTLYKAETAIIAACDTTPICATGSGRLTVVVSAAGLGQFGFSLTSPQTSGVAFTGTNTLTAEDSWGNTATTFDASANTVTITANAPLSGTVTGLGTSSNNVLNQAGNFTSGVANLTNLGMKYTGTAGTGTFTATSSTGKTGTSNSVTIVAPPKLTVKKTLVLANDAGLFDFTVAGTPYTNGGAGYSNNGSTGAVTLSTGSNTFSESADSHSTTALTDYVTTLACLDANNAAFAVTPGANNQSGTVSLSTGDNITCTFTNTRKPRLTVKKALLPTGDAGLFDFTIVGTPYTNSGNGYGNGGAAGPIELSTGSNTFSESADSHSTTALTDYVTTLACLDANSMTFAVTPGANNQSGTVSLSGGDNIICTFTNTRLPQITVTKSLMPTNDPGRFNLLINGTTDATNVGDTGSTGAHDGTIGASNMVSEAAYTGTSLTDYLSSISCTLNGGAAGSAGSGSGTSLTLNSLNAGDVVACTITNKRLPQVSVVKMLNPTADGGLFDLKIDATTFNNGGSGYGNSGSTGFQSVSFAPHTISEAGHGTTSLTDYDSSIACTGGITASGSSNTLSVDFTSAAAGSQTTCTITNKRRPQVSVVKMLQPTADGGLFDLKIDATTFNNGGSGYGNSGSTGFQSVSFASHTISEAGHGTTSLTDYASSISCSGGITASGPGSSLVVDFSSAAAGSQTTCTITNMRLPQIKVKKVTDPTTDTGTFDFTIAGTTYNNGGAGYGNGQDTGFQSVPFAIDTVSEAAHSGTILADYIPSISCTNGATSSTWSVTVDLNTATPGAQVTCTITNTKKPKLTINKVTDPTTDAGEFNLLINSVTDATNVGNGGTTNAQYGNISSNTFGETAGTGTSLSDYMPVISGTGCTDNGNGTGTITLAAGANKTCTITNTDKRTYTQVTSVSPNPVDYSDYVTLKATVNTLCTTCAGLPPALAGTVDFNVSGVNGSFSKTGNTLAASAAGVQVQVPVEAGSYTVTAVFHSTNAYEGSTSTNGVPTGYTNPTLTVNQRSAFIMYSGGTVGQVNYNLTLQATVWDGAASGYSAAGGTSPEPSGTIGDITKMWIEFYVYGGTGCGSLVASPTAQVVNSPGSGVGTATATFISPTEGPYCVTTKLVAGSAGGTNQWYTAPDAEMATIVLYLNAGEFATGGGWIVDPTGSHGNFGFNARYGKKGTPTGQMVYVWRAMYNGVMADWIIKSTSQNLTALSFTQTGGTYPNSALVQGGCILQIVQESNGASIGGQGNLTFTMQATDSGKSSGIGVDNFALTVLDGNNAVVKSVSAPLNGGNIVIHVQ